MLIINLNNFFFQSTTLTIIKTIKKLKTHIYVTEYYQYLLKIFKKNEEIEYLIKRLIKKYLLHLNI